MASCQVKWKLAISWGHRVSGPYDLIIQEASWGSFPWRLAELQERAALSITSTAFPWPEQAVRLTKDGDSMHLLRGGAAETHHTEGE